MFYEKIRDLLRAARGASLLSVVAFAIFFGGCSVVRSPAVFDYAAADARFLIEFPSRGETVVCSAEKHGGQFTLRAVSPERSVGLCVLCSDESCTIVSGNGEGIVLSPQASARLYNMLALLSRGEDGGSVSRSDDGETTVITYLDGTVTLGGDLMPTSAELFGDGGRVVKIREYTPLTDTSSEKEK